MKASESFKGFNPAKYGAQNPPSLEGFLFPATYDLPRHPTADDLVVRQLDAFKQYIAQVNMSYAKSKNLTPYDVLIIASMIEREVEVAEGAQAGRGGDLQPPPRRHAAPDRRDDPLRGEQLHAAAQPSPTCSSDSPYNTYTNSGPAAGADREPGPGLDPRRRPIPPTRHYLYYVVKPNTCGRARLRHHPVASSSAAKAAYDAARAAAGARRRRPTNCPGA